MTLSEKIFALRAQPILAGLGESEIAVLAAATGERRYAPGATVWAAGRSPTRLLFVCAGAVNDDSGRDQGSVPGAAALLLDRPLAAALYADRMAGALCLQAPRSHLYTLVRQCPAFVVGLLAENPPAPAHP